MAKSVSSLKILRSALGIIVAGTVFLSGLVIGSAIGGNAYRQSPCPISKTDGSPAQNSQTLPPVSGGVLSGGLLRGSVEAVSASSLTIRYVNPDPRLAKERAIKVIGISPETVVKERVRLSLEETNELFKKVSAESQNNGLGFAEPKTYKETDGKLSSIKIGAEVEVLLAEVAEDSGPKALQINYYLAP